MDIGGDDSDTESIQSAGSRSLRSVRSSRSTLKSVVKKDERPVKKLRPKKPMISNENDSVLTVCQMLSNKRGDAALIVGRTGGLAGILTDTDVTRRVVFANLDPSSTSVSRVMTPNPTMVSMDDSAMDALSTMVENRYRHLPVSDSSSAVVFE